MARKKVKLAQPDIDVDLTPMIDIIFLLIIFFILAGRITAEISMEKITVPPTRTAMDYETPQGWERYKIEVFGNTQAANDDDSKPYNEIKFGLEDPWASEGLKDFNSYIQLRARLDDIYDQADKFPDPKNPALQIPKVVLELRADGNTEYRVVQEILQVVSDSVDPNNNMLPNADIPNMKPFIHILYTTREQED